MKTGDEQTVRQEYPFDFSVVMAVYNVEPFLREAVDSLIEQDFGFEKIQLIMVDDGSTDGSGAICDEYAAQYPENVLVIHKENGGAASARNEGLKHIAGRYVNFLDADDHVSNDTFSAVWDFFAEHGDETDLVSIPIHYFGELEGPHWANRKFSGGSRIINCYDHYQYIQMSLAAAFLTHEAARKVQMDEALVIAEDAKEILKLLLEKACYGVVTEAKYFYRVHASSQVRSSDKKNEWYTDYLKSFSLEVLEYYEQRLGYIPYFVQYTVMYDLQRKMSQQKLPADLTFDANEYLDVLRTVLEKIDDKIIWEQKGIFREHKGAACSLKYGARPQLTKLPGDILLHFGNTKLGWVSREILHIGELKLEAGKICLAGHAVLLFCEGEEPSLAIKCNEKTYHCQITEKEVTPNVITGGVVYKHYFQCEISIEREVGRYELKFYLSVSGREIEKKRLVFGRGCPIGGRYKNAYYWTDRWKLRTEDNCILIERSSRLDHVKSELAFLIELLKNRKKDTTKAVFARLYYHVAKLFKRKKIWLISDKAYRADDNGEVFFAYVNRQKNRKIRSFFVIGKESDDYARLKKQGKVVGHMTWKHKRLLMLSDCVFSAYSHGEITHPFFNIEPYRDIIALKRFVFLQHGVIHNDVSAGLKKSARNISRFVTSAEAERRYVASPLFGYTDEEVWLTGLPRFDRLENRAEKKILVMPTWRRYLTGSFLADEDRWVLKDGFEKSEYYRQITALVNNERLLETAQRLGYEVHFVPHSTLMPYMEKFQTDPRVFIHGGDCKYYELFNMGSLLVTDYSSVVFDFAYLRKPSIYYQFDKEQFFAEHGYSQGYFDYERDGFGEVECDLEATVDRIIEYMERDCKLKEKYQERIDGFFAFQDQNNCQRVYEKSMALD